MDASPMGFADWVWESFVLEEALGAIIPTIPKLISTESKNMVVAQLGHRFTWCFIGTQ